MLKTDPCTYNIKYLHGEEIVVVLGVVIRVVLGLTHYATKKELEHATGVDKFDLAAKNIALKAEAGKLDINKFINALTSLNNLKIKVDDLDVGKVKTVPLDFKTLTDVV